MVSASGRAVVVGSGPNGLAGAVRLAQAGYDVTVLEAADRVGGGTRTSELTLPGLLHDDCSAFHPLGVASPYFATLDLDRHGLRWAWPEIQVGHPLDDGPAALLFRDLDRTVRGLPGAGGGDAWRRLVGPLVDHFDDLASEVLGPLAQLPRHPVTLARFGARAVWPASAVARLLRTTPARALWAGIAAHLTHRLDRPLSSAPGLILAAGAHAGGWPVAVGGSLAISRALVSVLGSLGGRVETGVWVRSVGDLGAAEIVLLDVTPGAAADLLGARLPGRVATAYRRFRHGPGSFKLDLAVAGGVPWRDPDLGRAGTVHLGGTFEEIAAAEAAVVRGRMPARPYVLVGQQYLADPSRSVGDVHPVWAYAHVPHGWPGDATESILDQIDRFAPGVRDHIVARHVRGAADLASYNPNYVGGDIAAGANHAWQALARPRLAVVPWATGVPGVYLCSASTAPGGGVHGMCGFNAAEAALARAR